jgi:hypothetical protein
VEDSLAVKPIFHYVPQYLPKGAENKCSHKNLHTDVGSSFTHNCQNLEATNMYFSKHMHEQAMYFHTMEYYSSLKDNELLSHEKTWRNSKCILLTERKQSKKATCFMIPTM